jgi:type II restriction enzyme
MELLMPFEPGAGYRSASQRARLASEAWGEANLYCCSCDSLKLRPCVPNSEAIDFTCPSCTDTYQLKSQRTKFSHRIIDAAYGAMCRAIVENRTPNLIALHYDSDTWQIKNALLVPRFTFSLSVIEKRKPLAATARRAGWIGCNIRLDRIPTDAKIPLIEDGVVAELKSVRHRYELLRPLETLNAEARGWTLDVLRIVRGLGAKQFDLSDVYTGEAELQTLHPGNSHVRAKIRQQLQRLRDLGFIEFLGAGRYRLRK